MDKLTVKIKFSEVFLQKKMEAPVTTEDRRLLTAAQNLGVGATVKRLIWVKLEALGMVEGGTAEPARQYSQEKIMRMNDQQTIQFLNGLGLWSEVQNLVKHAPILQKARQLGLDVNRLIWDAISKDGNPNGYSEKGIMNIVNDVPLFLNHYNLWPELQRMILDIVILPWEQQLSSKISLDPSMGLLSYDDAKRVVGDIVGLVNLINLGFPNELILNTALVGYDVPRIEKVCHGIYNATELSSISEDTRYNLYQLNSLLCDPNSYFWSGKLQQDFGITRIPEGNTQKQEYMIYTTMSDVNKRLIMASDRGQIGGVQKFLDQGANVNARAPFSNNTALMLASRNGHPDVVRLLLERGAKMEATIAGGNTALMLASRNGHLAVANLLLEMGADIDHINEEGETALIIATDQGLINMVKLLLEKGANVDSTDDAGNTALMYAVQRGNLRIVRLLLEKGADVNATNDYGDTILSYAEDGEHTDIIRLLKTYGAR